MALNNIMISREDYMAQKPYWDYQRKIEYNREKVNQGDMAGDGNDAKGKSKSKVDPAIFRMAEERDY